MVDYAETAPQLVTNKQWTLRISQICALLLFWQHHRGQRQRLHKEVTANWHLTRGHSCWLGPEQPPTLSLHSSGIMLSAGCAADKTRHWGMAGEGRPERNDGQVRAPRGDSSSRSGKCQGWTTDHQERYLEPQPSVMGWDSCLSSKDAPILNPMVGW